MSDFDKFLHDLDKDTQTEINRILSYKDANPEDPEHYGELHDIYTTIMDTTVPDSVRAAALETTLSAYSHKARTTICFANSTLPTFFLPDADYRGSTITGNLEGLYANLRLENVDLTPATLNGVMFIGCNTRGMRINLEQLTSVIVTNATLPDGKSYHVLGFNVEKSDKLMDYMRGNTR